ncbi:serine hydrolase [Spirosoma sp. KUDC1026]|uniref:serine hydrolase n=1 Tax=Spirosoma sp. KUDC1026 TaxID=2745947 RepID=UPI00159BEF48|nr:serine hydrolase [Spirosoma sp. KUDC1026]QKZ13495.1 serine hydrolase [Spirosoma sp. KUDC1026]
MKKSLTPLLLWLVLSLSSHAQTVNNSRLTVAFDSLLTKQFKPDGPGCTALVARKGQIIYQKAFGMANQELDVPMKPDNVFRIGSITKQFTAVAILQLMEQGKLSLQDEITRFIPDYPTQGKKITVEHLLTHTSGIKSYTDMKEFGSIMKKDMSPTELIDFFKNQPMEFEPGTKWAYCNSGYFLLGYIIEKVSGKTYPQYTEEVFFKPLGMTNSYYGDNAKLIKNRAAGYQEGKNGINNADYLSMTQPYAAGSIQSTVGDLWKWHQAVHSYKLVKKETLDKAFTRYRLSDGKLTNYGYGWTLGTIQGNPTIEHGGGINGFLTEGIYLPQEDVFVAVFSNSTSNSPDMVASKMAALTIGKPYDYTEIAIEPSALQSYTGVYENTEGIQRAITIADNQLYSQRTDSPRYKLKAYQRDKFFLENSLTNIEFIRNGTGQVEQIRFQSRELSETWKKTNKPLPATRPTISLSEKVLESYTGDYQITPNFILTITKEQNRLISQATGQSKFPLLAETETKFYPEAFEAQLEFIKDNTGKITKLMLLQGGQTTEAKKIK